MRENPEPSSTGVPAVNVRPRALRSTRSQSARAVIVAGILAVQALFAAPVSADPLDAGPNNIYVGSSADETGASSCADPDYSTNGDDEGNINLALDAALTAVNNDGDVIVVCDGIYEYDASTLVHDAGAGRFGSIAIHAETPGSVILHGMYEGYIGLDFVDTDVEVVGMVFQGLFPAIWAESSEGEEPHSLRVEESFFYVNANNWGGAIYAEQMNITVVDSVFGAVADNPDTLPNEAPNYASSDGGAIWATSDVATLVSIQRSVFEGNHSDEDGGAVWVGGDVRLEVEDSSFESNYTLPDPDHEAVRCGGAIKLANSDGALIEGSSFTNNRAEYTGGAIEAHTSCSGGEASTLEVKNSTFSENSAFCAGGAIEAKSLIVTDSRFISNSATDCAGGAIAAPGILPDADLRIERNEFADNALGDACCHGGALYLGFDWIAAPIVRDNRFVGNRAEHFGGGVVIWGDGRTVSLLGVQRNTFLRNSAARGGGLALMGCVQARTGFSSAQATRITRVNRFSANRGRIRRGANMINARVSCEAPG